MTRKSTKKARLRRAFSGRCASPHVQTTVEREVGTRGVTAFVGCNPGNDRRNFFRLTQTLGRHTRNDFLQHVRANGLDHVGADVAGAHGIDRHAFGCDFLRQRHGKAVQTGFGSGVIDLPKLAFLTVDRTDVDDAAKVGSDHVFNDLLGHVEHAVEVGRNDRVPVGLAHFSELAVTGDAGIVDQHADRAVFFFDLIERFNGGFPIADITDRGVEGVTQGFLLVNPLGEVARGAATRYDSEAVFGQALANGGSDTAHTTGHISYFIGHSIPFFYDVCYELNS